MIPYSGTAADRLTAVQSAISLCLSGQEYSLGGSTGQRVVRPNLTALREMEKQLLIEVNQTPGGFVLGEFEPVDF
jgi:hypothetical protein